MSVKITFNVTQDHLKLLKRLNFQYEDEIEFGAPAVDPKRPYGNSNVYQDIAEIIGLKHSDSFKDDNVTFSEALKNEMRQIHKDMVIVLNILVPMAM